MPSTDKLLFRRSPHLVCYWAGGDLVIENYATRIRVAADPVTCAVLDVFDRWRPASTLFARMSEFSPASLRKATAELVRHSFLERSDHPRPPAADCMDEWKAWNPAAGFFHSSTKDAPFTFDPEEVDAVVRRLAKKSPVPNAIKRYPKAQQIPLPHPCKEGEFASVLLQRRTWRRFSQQPIELAALGTLLGLTFGVQQWVNTNGLGRLALKTSPSGGARHPIEAYVVSLRVNGLPRGLYHYVADRHSLELLKSGANSRQVESFLAGQKMFRSPAALVLMTAVFARSQWKYEHPRAYRAVLLDAGHLCQTFCLVATWLGLAPFCTLALADSKVEKALGVDGVRESPIYAAGVGARPPGPPSSP